METTFTVVNNALISACINNNRNSQNELYNLIAPVIYTEILRDGFTQPEAEELLQQVFVEVFTSIKNYKRENLFDDWCMNIYKRIKKASF